MQQSSIIALAVLNERLNGRLIQYGSLDHAKQVACADGLKLSVQASRTHYCQPRDNVGPWYQVEVGYPTERCEALMPYAENEDRPTQTVYGYVPIEIVAQVIADHGGFLQAEAA